MAQDNDTIDLRDLLLVLRRAAKWVAAGAVLGLLVALAVTRFLPAQYEASSTVLLRNQPEVQLPDLARLSGLDGLGGLFPSASGFETELEILTSRAVVGEVVDSLRLQLSVQEPARLPADSLVAAAHLDPRQESEVYRFQREGTGYRVTGPGVSTVVAPGSVIRLPGGEILLREADLPDRFEVELSDREETITRVRKRLKARRAGGEVASLAYRDADPVTAAAVPNLLIDFYLQRRTSSDRGVNQRRYEFLRNQADSISLELAAAEGALRAYQETSGAVDPMLRGQAEFERAMMLRAQLETSNVEARTLREILARSTAGSLRTHDLAAYPTFINNTAINDLLSRILDIEVKRTELLQKRTPTDPDVTNLEETRRALEDQLASISRAYLSGLQQQQQEVQRELSSYRSALNALPAEGQQSLRLQREVRRLSETLLALQSQLVGARLAAMTEGGDVRRIDLALPPRKPVSPNPLLNLGVGGFAGGLLGLMLALGTVYLGQRVREPRSAERILGVPVISLGANAPLLLAEGERWGGVLVMPVGEEARAGPVARRLAETAYLRGHRVALLDLATADPASPALPAGGGYTENLRRENGEHQLDAIELVPHATYPVFRPRSPDAVASVRVAIEQLERQYSPVIVVLSSMQDPFTTALLSAARTVIIVARQGRVTHVALEDAFSALQRFGVPTAGVILHDGAASEATPV